MLDAKVPLDNQQKMGTMLDAKVLLKKWVLCGVLRYLLKMGTMRSAKVPPTKHNLNRVIILKVYVVR